MISTVSTFMYDLFIFPHDSYEMHTVIFSVVQMRKQQVRRLMNLEG